MRRYLAILILSILALSVGCTRDPVVLSHKYVDTGNKFYARGKYKEASIMYRKALLKYAKNGEAYYRFALTLLKLQDISGAAGMLRRSIDTLPSKTADEKKERVDAITKLADIYWMAYTAQPTRSKALLPQVQDLTDQLLKADPNSFDGLRLSGYIALANKDTGTALKDIRAARAARPNDPSIAWVLAQILMVTNHPDEAEALAKQTIARQKTFGPMYDFLAKFYSVRKQNDQVEAILKEKVANNPKALNYALQLAAFYYISQKKPEMEAIFQRLTSDPKDFPAAHLAIGQFYMNARDYDSAQNEFQLGMSQDPKEKAVYQKALVLLYSTRGDFQQATDLINTVLKKDPKDDQAIQIRSALLLEGNNPQQIAEATHDLEAQVQKRPQNAPLRYQYARALLKSNQPDAAIVQLQEAMRIRPDFNSAKVLLGVLLLRKGQNGKAEQYSEEVLAQEPRNLQAHLLRAESLMALGENDKARQDLQYILKVAPNSEDAKYQLGAISYQQKNYKDATKIFEEMRQSNPGDLRGLFGMVQTSVAEGNFKDAIKLLQDEMSKRPNSESLQLALAKVQVQGQMYDEAIKNYQQLIGKSSKVETLYLQLAETYRLKGDLNSAVTYFRKAISLAPNDMVPVTRLAMLLDATGRRDQAKPLYQQVLHNQPDNPIALNNLAFIMAEEGTDLDQALAYATRAKQRVPQDPNVSDTLGLIYIKKSMSDEAVRLFTDLVAHQPKNPIYLYHYAMALYQKGDKPTAKKECEHALESSPSKEDQQKIRELLARIGD
jgi:tetratricopeptide (TPR) repeat protein